MKVFLVGEAANHVEELARHVPKVIELIPLPRAAAYSDAYDSSIGPEDCVVSLKFSRPGSRMPKFRILHVPGAGLDGIDIKNLQDGCTVCNVFEHEIPIAEFVLLAMLEWQVKLRALSATFTAENWSDLYRHRRPHDELYGKTLGIMGLGRVGRAIAQRARAFGMQLIAVEKSRGAAGVDRIYPPGAFLEMLPQADFIAVTCPLTPETQGLFDKAAFAQMKSSAVFINVSRAAVAEEHALYAALHERIIAGAVLDVWYHYPANETETVAPSTDPFQELDNVIATPHSSAWTNDLPMRRYAVIGKNITNFLNGQPLLNVVRAG